jgi:hypothetical protein
LAARPQRFTESVGLKGTKDQLYFLQSLADSERKTLAEWYREALLASLKRPPATFFERALMAEIVATHNVRANLLYAIANHQPVDEARFNRILDKQHGVKFRDADDRIEAARQEATKSCPTCSHAIPKGGTQQ